MNAPLGWRRPLTFVVLAALPVAVLGIFFLLPVAGMVAQGFVVDGSFTLAPALDVLTRERTGRVLATTLGLAVAGTSFSLLLGLPAAYCLSRLDLPGRRALRSLLLVPFVLPTVVVGAAFRQLLGEGGPLGFLGVDGTLTAIVLGLAFFNASVVIRTVGAAWESLDPRPAEAAAALGATPLQVLRTVTWPSLRPSVVSAASVVFLFCATAFGIVLTLGGVRYSTVETEIYLLTTTLFDLPGAAALSVVQLLVVTVLLLVSAKARVPAARVQRRSVAPRRPSRRDLPALVVTALLLLLVLAPLFALLQGSLRVNTPEGYVWGLDNYRALAGSGPAAPTLAAPVLDALGTSLRTAVDATWMALLLGALVALVATRPSRTRGERRARAVLDGLFMLPLGVSAVTLGFGLLITLDEPPLDLRNSPLLVPLAQALVALPLVVRVLVPVLSGIDDRQRQAAASLGAGPLRTLATVDLPVVWKPLLAASGFAFATSLGEFGATSFLARGDDVTLPLVIFRLLGQPGASNYGTALAAAVVLAVVTATVMSLVERLRVPAQGAF
ncbi:ABC transporter permease [Nocardioides yefusunii]|uniref:ABC transporter permease n=1 Tax=Nocardioides yefusunii TaxID=2500546 RepID=A0ABW1QZM0_9ACTN|nr:ABC transporter permease subunit [Nocardioides yefusunii]